MDMKQIGYFLYMEEQEKKQQKNREEKEVNEQEKNTIGGNCDHLKPK